MKTFQEVIEHLDKRKRKISLLMGNGFSMSYDSEIFSYNALYDFLVSKDDKLISKLFEAIKTKNFELVMEQLNTTVALLDSFGAGDDLKRKIIEASNRLKSALLDSIQELHPEHVYKIPEESSLACAEFLNKFISTGGHIYTTNYDLLLYWVLMKEGIANPNDGFGRELLNPVQAQDGEEKEWSELIWGPNSDEQNIHYLHGALHIFDTKAEIVKEQYRPGRFLLENVRERLNNGSYPVFVTAGNGSEKLAHIRHNRYLSFCYDKLSRVDGSVVTFGFGFGRYDEHIIETLNRATHFPSRRVPKLWSIYIGTYSDADVKYIESIKHKFHAKVEIYDAKTVNVWGW